MPGEGEQSEYIKQPETTVDAFAAIAHAETIIANLKADPAAVTNDRDTQRTTPSGITVTFTEKSIGNSSTVSPGGIATENPTQSAGTVNCLFRISRGNDHAIISWIERKGVNSPSQDMNLSSSAYQGRLSFTRIKGEPIPNITQRMNKDNPAGVAFATIYNQILAET